MVGEGAKRMPGEESIAVVGLGYVGLPLALALARRFDRVTGFASGWRH